MDFGCVYNALFLRETEREAEGKRLRERHRKCLVSVCRCNLTGLNRHVLRKYIMQGIELPTRESQENTVFYTLKEKGL